MNKLIIYILLLCFSSLNAQVERPAPSREPHIPRDLFGQWLDKDGYVTEGPKIKNWVDSDRDRIDDRFQAGPGKPAGKKRPEVEKPKPKPQPKPRPAKPVKPNADKQGSSKPQKPSRPVRPELSDELKNKLDSYKKEKDQLNKELKDAVKKLEKPTREEVKEVIASFHKNNKARLDTNKELGKSIKEGLSANRPKKPQIPEEIKTLQKNHAKKAKDLHESKKKLMLSLKTANSEDRKKMLDAFKEEQKSLHDDLKSIQKQIRAHASSPKDNSTEIKTRPERRVPPSRPETKGKTTESRRPSDR